MNFFFCLFNSFFYCCELGFCLAQDPSVFHTARVQIERKKIQDFYGEAKKGRKRKGRNHFRFLWAKKEEVLWFNLTISFINLFFLVALFSDKRNEINSWWQTGKHTSITSNVYLPSLGTTNKEWRMSYHFNESSKGLADFI